MFLRCLYGPGRRPTNQNAGSSAKDRVVIISQIGQPDSSQRKLERPCKGGTNDRSLIRPNHLTSIFVELRCCSRCNWGLREGEALSYDTRRLVPSHRPTWPSARPWARAALSRHGEVERLGAMPSGLTQRPCLPSIDLRKACWQSSDGRSVGVSNRSAKNLVFAELSFGPKYSTQKKNEQLEPRIWEGDLASFTSFLRCAILVP